MKLVDLTGKRFTRWTVLERAGSDAHGNATWLCECDCGEQPDVVLGYNLTSGKSKSCGCLVADTARAHQRAVIASKALIGARFGRLTVERIGFNGRRSVAYARCACGARCAVLVYSLENGDTRSCGCLRHDETVDRMTTHGRFGTREHRTWAGMLNRCRNPNEPSYPNYGGRGIRVCSRWLSFENFYADMGDCPPRKSIDRIDVNGDYEPSNCRWATDHEQARNKRNNKLSTAQAAQIKAATKAGTETQAAIARRFGVSTSLVSHIHTGRTWAGV